MYSQLPERRRYHAALVTHLDESIGRIMAELQKQGLMDDTLVFFSSDNGVADKSDRGEGGGSNAPFREFKRSLFDGGIHMPAVVSWPRRLPQGESRSQLAIAMDLFVTVADAIGAELPHDRVIDGHNWLPFLSDPDERGQDVLFFEWAEQQAVRRGKWKVVQNGFIDQATLGRANRATGDDRIFLSDVSVSAGEKTNLYTQHPEVAQELLNMHAAWRESIEPKLPPVR
jgi:arylsulfatase A-like enzyme